MADIAMEDGGDAPADAVLQQQTAKRTGLDMVREELPRSSIQLSHTFGFDAVKRNNIHVLDDNTVALCFGNLVAIYTLGPSPEYKIQDTRYIFGESMGGVGCIGVHPSKKFIAVGCCAPPSTLDSGKEAAKSKSDNDNTSATNNGEGGALTSTPYKPYILIYEYPSLKLVKTLREGTEQGYSCLSFSGGAGDKLASVGMFPDFLLTTWDWQKERVILRTKAFAQDVYNVSFSPNNDGFLVSSGLAHIRFWAMAKTFTGLKLQGDIGKFGKVELSDVSAYAELPDGKVFSGSEHGSLLLWDGNIIKLEVRRPHNLLPHEGEVQMCVLLRGNEGFSNSPEKVKPMEEWEFLTAGDDGCFRWWSYTAIDTAETTDEEPYFVLKPSRELQLPGIRPRSISFGEGFAVIQNLNGGLHRVPFPFPEEPDIAVNALITLVDSHAGPINGMCTAPSEHLVVTAGQDSTVKLWDYANQKLLLSDTYSCAATCVAWVPAVLDALSQFVVVGFENGVVRMLARGQQNWLLSSAFKPHNGAVKDLAFSPKSNMCVSTGTDGTVFFFTVSTGVTGAIEFEPLGYVVVHQSQVPNEAVWHPDSSSVYLCLSEGIIEELVVPDQSTVDTEVSFELTVTRRMYTFKRRDIEAEKKKEAAMNAAMSGGGGEIMKKKSIEGEENEGEELVESSVNDEDETEAEEIAPVGNVLTLAFAPRADENTSSDVNFMITLSGADAGVLYECCWDKEFPLREYPSNHIGGSTRALTQSHTCKFLAYLGQDGSVNIRAWNTMRPFARTLLHSATAKAGTQVAMSYDDSFVLTAGYDGVIFVLRIKPIELEEHCNLLQKALVSHKPRPKVLVALDAATDVSGEDSNVSVQTPLFPGVLRLEDLVPDKGYEYTTEVGACLDDEQHSELFREQTQDISDDAAYSIQDAKLKTKEDEKRMSAGSKKDAVREQISKLQRDYAHLVKQNNQDMPERRLGKEDFLVDPVLTKMIEREGEALVEEVTKTMAWESKRLEKQLQKLHSYFYERLETEKITLNGLRGEYQVSSFRTLAFDAEVQQAVDAVLKEVRDDTTQGNLDDGHVNGTWLSSGSAGGQHDDVNQSHAGESHFDPGTDGRNGDDCSAVGGTATAEKVPAPGMGWEARKAGRVVRKENMDTLLSKKPSENDEDPKDVAAIQWATNNMGDYKLKTSAEYKVPKGMELSAKKKQKQCLLLAHSVQQLRMGFNERFLALRNAKKKVCEMVRNNNRRVSEITAQVHTLDANVVVENQWFQPVPNLEQDPSEWPETRFDSLQPSILATLGENKNGFADDMSDSMTSAPPQPPISVSQSASTLNELQIELTPPIQHVADLGKEMQRWASQTSVQMLDVPDAVAQLRLELKQLLQANNRAVMLFDDALSRLRRERMTLDADLRAAELRQLTEFQELVLLKNFEKKDHALMTKLSNCESAKKIVVKEIEACQNDLKTKLAEIEMWQDKSALISEEFTNLVGEMSPFLSPLHKMFKKKIKRARRKNEDGEGGSDNEDEDDEDDDDYDDDSDDDSEDDVEEDACPPGCDEALFDKVLELREKRLDHEDVLNEVIKAADELKKSSDRFIGKEKQIDKEVSGTILEIQAFQNEKQRELNRLDVAVVVNVDQLRCIDVPNDVFPEDLVNETVAAGLAAGGGAGATVAGAELGITVEEKEGLLEGGDLSDELAISNLAAVADAEAAALEREGLIAASKKIVPLPESIDECILFAKGSLLSLHNRIGQLEDENKSKKVEYRDLHLTQKRLMKERSERESDISKLHARCTELQMLKFGQEIDVDSLGRMGDSKQVFDLKDKILDQEGDQQKDLLILQKSIKHAQQRLLEATRNNTRRLRDIASMTERKQRVENELNATITCVQGRDGGTSTQREEDERRALVLQVREQARQVDAIKAEIVALRRKDAASAET